MDWLPETENFKIRPLSITVNKSFAKTFAKELVDACFSEHLLPDTSMQIIIYHRGHC